MTVAMRPWPALAVALMACAAPTEDGVAIGDPSPYIVAEQQAPEAGETIASVQQALQRGLDLVLDVNAGPVRVAHDEVMAHQGGGCPYYYATPDGSYWLDGCTAPSGATYNGYVFGLETGDVVDPKSGLTFNTWYAAGGATVVDPTGDVFELGGTAATQRITGFVGEGKLPYISNLSVLQGSFGWEGSSAGGTFLAEGIDPDLQLRLQEIVGMAARTAVFVGGFGGYDGGWAIAFDENLIFTASLGSDCPDELSGTVAVRSPVGEWFDVRFDGPVSEAEVVAAEDCDGCGTAYFHGEEFGEVCVDASALLGWESDPW